jgi:hypothetical protein
MVMKRKPKAVAKVDYGAGDVECTGRVAARWLMVNDQHIVNLNRDGWIHKTASSKYRLVEVIQGYLHAKTASAKTKTRSAAEDRLRVARAREVELRTAIRARELIEMVDAVASVQSLCGAVRAEFGSLAARVTTDLGLRGQIEEAVNEALNRIADRLGEETAVLQRGSEDTEGSEDDDDMGVEASDVLEERGDIRRA